MGKYRKFIVALLGVGALFALRQLEIEIMGVDQIVLEMIASAATAWGVYQVRNDPMDG